MEPSGNGDVTVNLPATTDCDDGGAICTDDGRMLSTSVEVTVAGPDSQAGRPNTPATGAPTITGTVRVGETLTAATTGISDADGTANATFSYQWLADDVDIQGATGATYTLVDADEGKTVKVKVKFTDDAGNEESLTSAATATVAARSNAPATGAPTITGILQVGETLTADTSGIGDADGLTNASYSYQWLADDVDIGGATGATYTLVDADEGKTVKVKVTFTDDAGNEESLTSDPTEAVATRSNAPATGAPTISGTAQVGETLTADTSGIRDADGLTNASYRFQWLADDSDIQGAASASYTLVDADEGKAIKVRVSFTDDEGNEESLTSEPTEAVATRSNTPATGAPTITGILQVGETLTADTSGIGDADGLTNASYSYQWLADDVDIGGATGATYTLVDADEGKTVKVKVTFTDDRGRQETLTSAATGAVAAAPSPLTAGIHSAPPSHDGSTAFTFELHFSEEPDVSFRTLRDHAFTVTNGEVRRAKRLEETGNVKWQIRIKPSSNGDVTVVLPVTEGLRG